ncbi:GTP cyclohydrolase 1 type 2/Nif3 [Phlebopus sp. FC_14]|nr:GTP cyclohydrolase 1 type 2/Nif3 [Phlebopus sp. FC_14]
MASVRFKLVFFTPRTDTAKVLNQLFSKCPQHLGKIGNYEQCAFITPGVGQFQPAQGANPTLGTLGVLEKVEEDRVEILLHDKGERRELSDAIQALKEVHPYEEVAYDVYRLEDV